MEHDTESLGGWSAASELLRGVVRESVTSVELGQVLEALETRINATKTSIQDVLAGHLPEYMGTFSCSHEVEVQLKRLREDLSHALAEAASEDTVDAVGTSLEADRTTLLNQLQHLREYVSTLESLQSIQSKLESLDTTIEQLELLQAAKDVKRIEEDLDGLTKQMEDFIDSKVYRALRVQVRRKKAKLIATADETLQSTLLVEESCITISFRDSETPLTKALEALDVLDSLRSSFSVRSLSNDLFKCILLPILQSPHAEIRTTAKDTSHSLHVVCRKSEAKEFGNSTEFPHEDNEDLVDESDDAMSRAEQTFENILHVFQFIEKYVLDGHSQWLGLLFNATWGAVDFVQIKRETQDRLFRKSGEPQEPSLSHDHAPCSLSEGLLRLLIDALPKEVAGLQMYHTVSTSARSLEHSLVEMGLFPSSSAVLEPFLADTENYLAQKRRATMLYTARQLILADYFSSTVISSGILSTEPMFAFLKPTLPEGDAPGGLFQFEACYVTQCAVKVAEMGIQAMDEAVQSSASATGDGQLAFVLYQTCRDVFELFRMLVPKVYGKDLESTETCRTALLFHNDCLFLAHVLVLLGFVYKKRLPLVFAQQVITVDLVPPFRDSALQYVNGQVKSQMDRVAAECFGPVPKLVAEEEDGEKGLTEGQAAAGLVLKSLGDRLSRCTSMFQVLEREWKSLLSKSVFKDVIVAFANGLLMQCVEFVSLKLPPSKEQFTPNEIAHLRAILDNVREKIGQPIHQLLHESAMKMAPGLLALTQICAALNQYMSAHMFQESVENGSLHALSNAQIRGLAKVLFPGEDLSLL